MNIVQQLKTSIPPFLRQIGGMAEMRKTRHQNRRQRGLIPGDCSRLLEITGRETQLMNHCRRKHVSVVEPQRVGLERVMNAE